MCYDSSLSRKSCVLPRPSLVVYFLCIGEGQEIIFQLLGEVSKSKELLFFNLSLSICRTNNRIDTGVVFGGYQSQRNGDGIVQSLSLIKQYMARLATVYNLKILNLEAVPPQRSQCPSDNSDPIVHQHKS